MAILTGIILWIYDNEWFVLLFPVVFPKEHILIGEKRFLSSPIINKKRNVVRIELKKFCKTTIKINNKGPSINSSHSKGGGAPQICDKM